MSFGASDEERDDPFGERDPLGATAAQQNAKALHEHHVRASQRRGPVDAGSGGLAAALTLRALPFLAVLAAVVFTLQVIRELALPYRRILVAVLPDAWFLAPGVSEPNPGAAAGVVGGLGLAVLLGLLVGRRRYWRDWVAGHAATGSLWAGVLPLSLAAAITAVTVPALALGAGAVATGDIFRTSGSSPTIEPAWPLTITGLTIVYLAVRSSRRVVAHAVAVRHAAWRPAGEFDQDTSMGPGDSELRRTDPW